MVDLVMELLLVFLLLLTITWCVIVHVRLRRFRLERGELQALIDALGFAAGRAEAAITGIKEAGAQIEDDLRRQHRQASVLIDELRCHRVPGSPKGPATEGVGRVKGDVPGQTVPAGLKAELLEALAALR